MDVFFWIRGFGVRGFWVSSCVFGAQFLEFRGSGRRNWHLVSFWQHSYRHIVQSSMRLKGLQPCAHLFYSLLFAHLPASCRSIIMWFLRLVVLIAFWAGIIPAPKYPDCGDDEDEENEDEYIPIPYDMGKLYTNNKM